MKSLFLAINASYSHTSLSARYIRAACAQAGLMVHLHETNVNERAEKTAQQVALQKPDVLLCSAYIWNTTVLADVCTRLKLMLPEIIIVWGGPEVSYNPDNVLAQYNFIDYVCLGEGEVTVPKLIQLLEQGQPTDNALGIVSRTGGVSVRPQVENLDLLPDPYQHEDEFSPNKLYYFETSRGCPYSCSYCLSSAESGVRFMSLTEAVRRLTCLAERVPLIKFVDRTFNASPRRARDLWTHLLRLAGTARFHFEICAHLLREEDFVILSQPEAARFQFEVGLQSTYEPALTAINRAMDTEKLLSNVERLISLKTIEVHLDLIAGLPGEDYTRFLKTFDEAIAVRPHRLHLGFLKLLPGTVLRSLQEQEGYAYLPFAPYEVLRSKALTAYDLLSLKAMEQCLNRYYNSGNFAKSMSYLLSILPGSEIFTALSGQQDNHPYVQLQDVFGSHVPDALLLKELLRYDFCIQEPHRRIPEELTCEFGDEDTVLRNLLYNQYEQVMSILPHRQGEKAGSLLRNLRHAYFRPETLQYLGLGLGTACLFDYTQPPGHRAFVLTQ